MKKFIALLLIGVMATLVACADVPETENSVYENFAMERVDRLAEHGVPEYALITAAVFEVTEDWGRDEISVLSMISEIEKLVIHISDDTPIYFANGENVRDTLTDGQTLADILDGRILEVWSTMMLQSFPGQTFPHFIRVWEEYDNLKDGYIIVEMISGNIMVNGDLLDTNTHAPFWARGSVETEDGFHATTATAAMVPLQPIADALGIEVEQLFGRRGVSVDGASIGIDDTKVYIPGFPPIELELPAAPAIDDEGVIFVPTELFSDILNYNVFIFRGA